MRERERERKGKEEGGKKKICSSEDYFISLDLHIINKAHVLDNNNMSKLLHHSHGLISGYTRLER